MLKFLINSNVKSAPIVLERLINSFYNQSLPITNDLILVVLGGSSNIYFKRESQYCVLGVPHNSIDFTALIGVIEHIYTFVDHGFKIPDYWFYIHDTCELGKDFLQLLKPHIRNLYIDDVNIKPLTYIKSMNIGIYKYLFLLNHKDHILKYRSHNHPTYEQIQYLKHVGVSIEDFIFQFEQNQNQNQSFMLPHKIDRMVLGESKMIYENSTIMRITEYFDQLDLYKYKANWELKNVYILDP